MKGRSNNVIVFIFKSGSRFQKLMFRCMLHRTIITRRNERRIIFDARCISQIRSDGTRNQLKYKNLAKSQSYHDK